MADETCTSRFTLSPNEVASINTEVRRCDCDVCKAQAVVWFPIYQAAKDYGVIATVSALLRMAFCLYRWSMLKRLTSPKIEHVLQVPALLQQQIDNAALPEVCKDISSYLDTQHGIGMKTDAKRPRAPIGVH